MIPAYEYLVEGVRGLEEFYVIGYKGAKGYFWYFPLDNNRGYMGAGDVEKKYYGISEFFKQHPEAKVAKKIGRPIRLAPPKRMEPFVDGNVIGVGESIGCVFPMLGEGIIPSLICCDIFLEVLGKNGKRFDAKLYRKKVLDRFPDDRRGTCRLARGCRFARVGRMPALISGVPTPKIIPTRSIVRRRPS